MSELDDIYAELNSREPSETEPVIPSKYDAPGTAGLASAARALTFGLSDPLLRYGLNVDPKTLEGLKEANPKASFAGEVGGIGLGLATGVGAPAAIAKAGRLVRGAQELTASARLIGAAGAGVAEGGLYGLGQYISEASLEENPNLSAEKLFASVAGGATTGLLLGGAGQGVAEGFKAGKDAVLSRLKGTTLREWLKEQGAKSLVRSVASPADYRLGKLDDAAEIGDFGLKAMSDESLLKRDPYAMADKFAEVKRNIGAERIGKLLDEADAASGMKVEARKAARLKYKDMGDFLDEAPEVSSRLDDTVPSRPSSSPPVGNESLTQKMMKPDEVTVNERVNFPNETTAPDFSNEITETGVRRLDDSVLGGGGDTISMRPAVPTKAVDPAGVVTAPPALRVNPGFDMRPALSKFEEVLAPLRKDPANDAFVSEMERRAKRYLEQPLSFRDAFKIQSDLWKTLPDGPLKAQPEVMNKFRDILKNEIKDQAEALVPEASEGLRSAMRDWRSAAELERMSAAKADRLEAMSMLDPRYYQARFLGGIGAHVLDRVGKAAASGSMAKGFKSFIDRALEMNPMWGGALRGELELASARGASALLQKHIELADKNPEYLGMVGHLDEEPQTLDGYAGRVAQVEEAAQLLENQNRNRDKIFSRFLSGVSPRTGSSLSEKEFKELSEHFERANTDPDYLATVVGPGALSRVAPDLEVQLSAVGAKAVKYLQATMPKSPYGVNPVDSLLQEWKPSELQLARWSRCVRAVQNPNSVVASLQDGSVTKEGVEALKMVYPEFYADTQRALMERLATHKKLLSFEQRQALATFIGGPMAGAGDRSKLILSQNLYNNRRAEQAPPGNKQPDGRQRVSQEENSQTQAQRIEGR